MTSNLSSPQPRRRWFQFSLRTLLIFMSVSGAGLGWFGVKVQDARRQEAAVKDILGMEGNVFYDYQIEASGRLAAKPEPPGPEWLKKYVGQDFFSSVVYVEVNLSRARGRQNLRTILKQPQKSATNPFASLSEFRRLRWLDLIYTNVTDADLASLEHLSELERLDLRASEKLTDAGMDHLKGLKKLKWLGLANCQITDAGLEKLAGLTQLEKLHLSHTLIGDDGLVHLKGMTRLDGLGLDGTNISDSAFRRLSSDLPLTALGLAYTKITDAAVYDIVGYAKLQNVWVLGTRLTFRGLGQLQKDLPNCKLVGSPPKSTLLQYLDSPPKLNPSQTRGLPLDTDAYRGLLGPNDPSRDE